MPGVYALILPLVRSDAIMSEGPARWRRLVFVSNPGKSMSRWSASDQAPRIMPDWEESGTSDTAMTTFSSPDTAKASGYLEQLALSTGRKRPFMVLLPMVMPIGHVSPGVLSLGMLIRSSAQDRPLFSRYPRYCSSEGYS